MSRRTRERIIAETCAAWNQAHPIGTLVQFHPVIGGRGYRERTTRSEAYVLSGHTAVIMLDGESGCVALEACRVVDLEARKQ